MRAKKEKWRKQAKQDEEGEKHEYKKKQQENGREWAKDRGRDVPIEGA